MPHRLRVCVETLVRLSESSTESNACMIPDGVMVLSSQAAKSSILELLHANMIITIVMGLLITKTSSYHILALISYGMFSSKSLCEAKTILSSPYPNTNRRFTPQLTRAAGRVPFSQACGTFSARSALFPVGTTDNLHADNRPADTPADNTDDAAAGVGRAPCGR